MDRRGVLKLGAVAATTAQGCATVLSAATPPVVPEALTAIFARLDSQLLRLENEKSLLPSMLGDTPNRDRAQAAPWFQEGDALARKTLKTFLIAGTFQSLTPEQWQQPLTQERLANAMVDFDESTLGMTSMLERLTPGDRKSLGTALRQDPGLGMRIMGAIDERAGAYGVSAEGRLKLRAAASEAVSRLRQSPELIIDDTTGKIRKLEARHGAMEAARRRLGVSMATVALFDQDPNQPATGGPPPLTSPPPPPIEPAQGIEAVPTSPAPAAEGPTPAQEAEERRKSRGRTNGIIGMTVGAVSLGLVALFAVTGFGSNLLLVTLGVLLGALGVVALIGGLILFLTSL